MNVFHRHRVLSGVALLLLVTAGVCRYALEPGLFMRINHACAAAPAALWTGLSVLGNGWGLLALTAPLAVLAPRLMWAWLCAAPFAALLSRTVKSVLEWPRPAGLLDPGQFHLIGEPLHRLAFPSGHTLSAFAAATALHLALSDPAQTGTRVSRPHRLGALLYLLAAAAGLSRIAVGAHWPADVLGGAALGLVAGGLGYGVLRALPAGWYRPLAPAQGLVLLLLVASAHTLATGELDFEANRPLQQGLLVWLLLWLGLYARMLWRAWRRPGRP